MVKEVVQPKTAFVFAGGGSLGAVQVGVLQSILAHGVTWIEKTGMQGNSIPPALFPHSH